jgi:hypothetical protein
MPRQPRWVVKSQPCKELSIVQEIDNPQPVVTTLTDTTTLVSSELQGVIFLEEEFLPHNPFFC